MLLIVLAFRARDEKQDRLGPQPYTNLRLRVPPRFTGGGTPAHDHELGEGLEAEGLSGENPIDTRSVTTVITMKYGNFHMCGYDITVPGYRRTFRKAEPDLKEGR